MRNAMLSLRESRFEHARQHAAARRVGIRSTNQAETAGSSRDSAALFLAVSTCSSPHVNSQFSSRAAPHGSMSSEAESPIVTSWPENSHFLTSLNSVSFSKITRSPDGRASRRRCAPELRCCGTTIGGGHVRGGDIFESAAAAFGGRMQISQKYQPLISHFCGVCGVRHVCVAASRRYTPYSSTVSVF